MLFIYFADYHAPYFRRRHMLPLFSAALYAAVLRFLRYYADAMLLRYYAILMHTPIYMIFDIAMPPLMMLPL